MPLAIAERCCALHRQHRLASTAAASRSSALSFVPLPLPKTDGELLARCVGAIPPQSLQRSLERSLADAEFAYVCGAGLSPALLRYLGQHRAQLNALQQGGEPLALLSIVEDASLAHGSPNCDFVGAVSYGAVAVLDGELPLTAALRAVEAAACLGLPLEEVRDAHKRTHLRLPPSWLPAPEQLCQHWAFDDDRQTSRGGRRAKARVHVFCRVLPPGGGYAVQMDAADTLIEFVPRGAGEAAAGEVGPE